jgi:hypothetical protein
MKEIITNKYSMIKKAQIDMGSHVEGYPEGVREEDINEQYGGDTSPVIGKENIDIYINWDNFYNWINDKQSVEQYSNLFVNKDIKVVFSLNYNYDPNSQEVTYDVYKIIGEGGVDLTNSQLDEYAENDINNEIQSILRNEGYID